MRRSVKFKGSQWVPRGGASDSGNKFGPAAGSLTSALCCLAIFEIRPMVQGTQAQVAIIGGGIGGLTAAASLLRTGFEVQVYEQARSLGEVGAGINIGPNASRILHRLG